MRLDPPPERNAAHARPAAIRVIAVLIALLSAACRPAAGPRDEPGAPAGRRPTETAPRTPARDLLPGEAVGARCLVAADHPVASRAGLEILRLGGNAVDAAVAVSFTLSVVRPDSCGIGGGGFMLIHLQNDPRFGTLDTAIDYRERAPAAAAPGMFESLPPGASTDSGAAVAVPGTVAGLLYALDRYGTLPRETVLAPAIRAATEGFAIDSYTLASRRESLLRRARLQGPDAVTAVNAMLDAPEALRPGAIVADPEQARALALIRDHGVTAFYQGEIARAIIDTVRLHGGLMTTDDLAAFEPREVKPIEGRFMGRRVLAMPPPSSGGIALLQILGVMERRPETRAAAHPKEPLYTFILSEAMRHAFADRARYLADPEFTTIPIDKLLDPAMLDARAAAIDPSHATPIELCGWRADLAPHNADAPAPARGERRGEGPSLPPFLKDDHGTSHFSIIDSRGHAVACTETINIEYGSGIAVAGFGFMLNNEMDDFLTRRGEVNAFGLTQADANLPGPRKRPLSSMTPTILLSDRGEVELVAGGSGGPRIISATAQAVLNAIVFGMTAGEAVAARRVHHQWRPDTLVIEPGYSTGRPWNDASHVGGRDRAAVETMRRELLSRGCTLGSRDAIAQVQLVRRATEGEGWNGASDPRKGGEAAGE